MSLGPLAACQIHLGSPLSLQGAPPPSLRAIMGSHAVAFDALQHPQKPSPRPPPCEVCLKGAIPRWPDGGERSRQRTLSFVSHHATKTPRDWSIFQTRDNRLSFFFFAICVFTVTLVDFLSFPLCHPRSFPPPPSSERSFNLVVF